MVGSTLTLERGVLVWLLRWVTAYYHFKQFQTVFILFYSRPGITLQHAFHCDWIDSCLHISFIHRSGWWISGAHTFTGSGYGSPFQANTKHTVNVVSHPPQRDTYTEQMDCILKKWLWFNNFMLGCRRQQYSSKTKFVLHVMGKIQPSSAIGRYFCCLTHYIPLVSGWTPSGVKSNITGTIQRVRQTGLRNNGRTTLYYSIYIILNTTSGSERVRLQRTSRKNPMQCTTRKANATHWQCTECRWAH